MWRPGCIAQDAGVAAVALHARTAAQRYSGRADWEAIATLKEALDVPVLGNGDIWEADDALRMVAGDRLRRRGHRARLPGPAVAVRRPRGGVRRPGRAERPRLPALGEVALVMRRHAELLTEWLGTERDGCTDFRKHVAWYLKGFPVGSELRRAMAMVSSLSELDDLLGKLDPAAPFPVEILGEPRGRTNSPGRVALPDGWLSTRDDDTVPLDAELDDSGG